MATKRQRHFTTGTYVATVEREGKSAHLELTYHLSVDRDSIIRQLAPIAAAQQGSLHIATRLNGAVVLTVVEENEADT